MTDTSPLPPSESAETEPSSSLPVPGTVPTSTATPAPSGVDAPSAPGVDTSPSGGTSSGAVEGGEVDPDADGATIEMPERDDLVEPPVDGPLTHADVPAEHTITGTNPADGRPTVIDPTYRDAGDAGNIEARLLAASLQSNPGLTDAERDSGEVTVSSRGDVGDEPIDAKFIGMGTAMEYRPRKTVRVMRVDQAFTVDGRNGAAGDYLAEEPDGTRHHLTAAQLNEHFVAI